MLTVSIPLCTESDRSTQMCLGLHKWLWRVSRQFDVFIRGIRLHVRRRGHATLVSDACVITTTFDKSAKSARTSQHPNKADALNSHRHAPQFGQVVLHIYMPRHIPAHHLCVPLSSYFLTFEYTETTPSWTGIEVYYATHLH